MTVIAWDGYTLAADKRGNSGAGSPVIRVTKIRRLADGSLVGWCGGLHFAEAIVQWIEAGADPQIAEDKWFEHEELAGQVLRIMPDKTILLYEHAFPITVENHIYAIGSGSPYAAAAMFLGHSAETAVTVASEFDTSCGNGVDTLQLEELINEQLPPVER